MPNWKKFLGPLPKKARYAVQAVGAAAAVVIIATTERTIPIPWQAIPITCAAGLVLGVMHRIGSDVIEGLIDWAVAEATVVLGLHFYPAALRDSWPAIGQLASLILLPGTVVIGAMEYLGLGPRRESTGGTATLDSDRSVTTVQVRRDSSGRVSRAHRSR
ncbi:MAG TPA: hypothetical protein VK807_11160 [Gemmatimonadaceae bacterium]|nr:hypothetical protein [Gemmatimonadaceae bacterium]